MELKDFIKDTITQISDAVTELNNREPKYKLTVNPYGSIGNQRSDYINIAGDHCPIANIEFDLTITASENKGNDAKVGVFATVAGIGASKRENTNNEAVSKIRFILPVLLPGNNV